MEQNDLTRLRQYCATEDCGKPTLTEAGTIVKVRQPLEFVGFNKKNQALYVCMQCGYQASFALNKNKSGFHLVQSGGCETMSVVLLLSFLVCVFGSILGSLGN